MPPLRPSLIAAAGLWLAAGAPLAGAPSPAPAQADSRPVLHVQMCRDCPPFEYRENGRDKGLAHDLVEEAAASQGLRLEVTPYDWTGALDALRRRDPSLDAVLAVTASPERARWMLFSRPYVSFPQVIFTAKDRAFVAGLDDLKGRPIAVENGYLMVEMLRRALPEAVLLPVSTTVQALQALSRGEVDAYVGNLATGTYLIERLGLVNLKVAAPTPFEDEAFSLGVRADEPELLARLQAGLDAVSPAERERIRNRYLAVRYEFGLRPRDILKWVLLVLLGAGAFIFQLRRMVAARSAELAREAERRAQAEAQLLQARKLEALGTLAGGIAHDFNNVLTGIGSYLDLASQRAAGKDALLERDLHEAGQGVRRAADLVHQILSFSRQRPQAARLVRAERPVQEALTLVRPTLPASLRLELDLHCGAQVLADPGELHRVTVNLCTNAARAMEGRQGVLAVSLGEETVEHPPAGRPAGPYVRLSVRDSGAGVPPEIQDKIFDPYFTTSKDGQGMGLGLAVVHGLVEARGGFIRLESRPGEGACFHVYWPSQGPAGPEPAEPEPSGPQRPSRFLFVDDEPALTEPAVRLLQRLGHTAEGFTRPEEALARFRAEPDAFDVAILDRSMPGLNGLDLARALRALRPGLAVILCSGFHEQDVPLGQGQPVDAAFDKPVPVAVLAEAASRILKERGR